MPSSQPPHPPSLSILMLLLPPRMLFTVSPRMLLPLAMSPRFRSPRFPPRSPAVRFPAPLRLPKLSRPAPDREAAPALEERSKPRDDDERLNPLDEDRLK